MDEGYELLRGERRSFFCSNKLWKELQKQTHVCFSVSQYIKMALIEKMKKDNPGIDNYFDELNK